MVKKEFMTIGITYSDHNMTISKEKCLLSMTKHGIDGVAGFEPGHVENYFKLANADIWAAKRGPAYWLWKPYVIYEAISPMKDGDILVYSDAGVEFVDSVKHITDRMDQDIFFFTNGFPHVEWCKGDVWGRINGFSKWSNDDPEIMFHYSDTRRKYTQVQASVIFFRVNETTRNFVKEWLLWCQMPGFIDDSPSNLPNYPTFAEHRHDQAILTCLQIKYGYKLHFWPTNYSEHIRHTAQPGDDYPTLFNHHRKRNHEW